MEPTLGPISVDDLYALAGVAIEICRERRDAGDLAGALSMSPIIHHHHNAWVRLRSIV